ncbi:ABC transporter permease [Candidatus Eisenbacteria bacterium]|uniref:ABC transporter permease n=1 Tax=Eiseniibacteriota bacterium TaxID=2212470 RepID=A0ABV6YKP3_UNCEI
MVFLLLPLVVTVAVSLDVGPVLRFPPEDIGISRYVKLLSDPLWLKPLLRSLRYAVCVALVSTAIGLVAAYAIRQGRLPFQSAIVGLLLLPLFFPPVVLAVGQLKLFTRLGAFDTGLSVVLCHSVLCVPITFLVMFVSLSNRVAALEDIAATLGATPFLAFTRVTLPLITRGLGVAAFLSFMMSFDEAVLSLFLTSHRARTLPRQIYDGLRYELDPVVAAVAGLLVFFWSIIVLSAVLRRSWIDSAARRL